MNRQGGFERRARAIRKRLRRYPALTPLVDRLGLLVWRRRLKRMSRTLALSTDPHRQIWIRPFAIHRGLRREQLLAAVNVSNQRDLIGLKRPGSWDRPTFMLDEDHGEPIQQHFIAIQQHLRDGTEWDETPFFKQLQQSILDGKPRFRYRTLDDLQRRWAHIDDLYEKIKRCGYLSQKELGTHRPWDEVAIAIDSIGRLLFVNGVHRLAIARVLELEQIPAVVALRHEDWVAFANGLRAEIDAAGGRSYQPLLHPDLADIPTHKGHDRFELIRTNLSVRSGNLVDIGANRGYFCHRFEDAGFKCVAIERSKREAFFLRRLRDAAGKKFEIVEGAVENVDFKRLEPDVVLALNVFHHFLKTRESFEALGALLQRLETEHMVFEPHLADDPQMSDAYRNLAPGEFVDLVMDRANLRSCTPIGDADDGRPLFILSR